MPWHLTEYTATLRNGETSSWIRLIARHFFNRSRRSLDHQRVGLAGMDGFNALTCFASGVMYLRLIALVGLFNRTLMGMRGYARRSI